MKQCIALAGLACLLVSGCAGSGFSSGRTAGYVAASQRAPRPAISRDYRKPGPEPAVQLAAYADGCCDASCGCDECTSCGCPVEDSGCCANGCCEGGCSTGPCRRLIDGIAGGGCGNGNGCGPGGCGICGAHGLCPHSGGYPEYPAFNPGPAVGQVAYPYYTVRGPRDFLRNNPPTIGPY
jgi:hypothetical protein